MDPTGRHGIRPERGALQRVRHERHRLADGGRHGGVLADVVVHIVAVSHSDGQRVGGAVAGCGLLRLRLRLRARLLPLHESAGCRHRRRHRR